MKMKRPRLLPAVLAMAVALASATTGVASADISTVGSPSLTPNGGTGDSLSPAGAPVFQGDAGGGYVVTSPVTGTITSWSFLSGGVAQGKLFALRVLRANADGISWSAVATSATVGVTSATGVDAVNGPFGDHVPIQAGDRIALQPVDDNLTPIEPGTFGQDGIRYFTTALADGQSAPLAPGSGVDNGQVVPIQATIQFTNGTLSVVLAGSGSGSVSGDQSPSISCPAACSQKYPAGTVVTLHESPAAGSSFTGWGDACAGTSSTCQVTLDADTTVAATFSKGATTPAPRNTKPPLIHGTPKAGQTLNCSGDTWVGGGIPSVAWFETEVTSRIRLGRSVQIATGRSLVLGDYPPGATIGCTVTFTNAGGSAAANAADVTVLAVIPSLSRILSSRTPPSNSPAIDPTIGFGGKNTCTTGTWAHYPRRYTFEWFALPFMSSKLTPSLRVGTDQTLTITGAEESQYLVCRVTASNGAGPGIAVSNRYVVPASNLGVHVNAIEITQGIQTPEVPTRSPLNPAANHVSYQGVILPWEDPNAPPVTVKLAEHHATVVRVYANTSVPIGGHAVPGMLLRAFRDGRQLPPGPIESDQLPPSRALPVGRLGENPSNNGLRTDPGGAYTFTLPWDWTTGDVTFEAQTQFSRSRFNAICVVCAEEGTIFLGPEHFNRVTSARIDALAFKLDTNHGTYLPAGDPGPSPAWTQVQAVVPFPLYVPRYLAELDGTGVINATSHTQGFPCITDCTISITKDATDQSQPFYHWQTQQLVQKVIDWANDNDTLSSHFPFGIVPNGLGFGGGVTDNGGGNNILYGDGQPRAMSVDSRPVDGIAHEFHHGLGRQHADLICGGQLKVNGGSESWPPNNDGLLDGVGLDTSSPSPYTILSNSLQTFTSRLARTTT